MKIKVTKNIYGNFSGWIGNKKTELGCEEFRAKDWLVNNLYSSDSYVLSLKSFFTFKEIIDFIESSK